MIKFILRVLYLPLVVICYIIKWIATLTIKCSATYFPRYCCSSVFAALLQSLGSNGIRHCSCCSSPPLEYLSYLLQH